MIKVCGLCESGVSVNTTVKVKSQIPKVLLGREIITPAQSSSADRMPFTFGVPGLNCGNISTKHKAKKIGKMFPGCLAADPWGGGRAYYFFH